MLPRVNMGKRNQFSGAVLDTREHPTAGTATAPISTTAPIPVVRRYCRHMRYSIVKFESTYGARYYQVRLHYGLWFPWLKGSHREILTFESREDAHEYMRRHNQSARQSRGHTIEQGV